jgi:putative CocE/NonD family hydrolase
VSSNVTDTDFTVKIVDSFPDNVTNTLIQDSIIRMRWRESSTVIRFVEKNSVFLRASLMTPGTVYEVTIDLWSTCYYFNQGHRIRIDISSSNSPRFSANPNNGLLLNQSTVNNLLF